MERVAVVGTGTMGAPIAVNLARAGLAVAAWNRTPAKAEALAADGVAAAATPAEAVAGADAVGIVVTDDAAVEAVLDGPDGILAGLRPGALVLDLSTTSIPAKQRFADRVRSAGGRPVEAPVFGSRPQAEAGALWPVVGGRPEDVEAARPFLAAIGEEIVHAGPIGAASAVKLAGNLLLFAMMSGLSESVALVEAHGADPEHLLAVVARTGFRSPYYESKGAQMLTGDYAPRFTIANALKDLRLILGAAADGGVELTATAATARLFERALSGGHGEQDMAALIEAVRPAPAAQRTERSAG